MAFHKAIITKLLLFIKFLCRPSPIQGSFQQLTIIPTDIFNAADYILIKLQTDYLV